MIEEIISITYNHLVKNQIDEKDAKDYASKNILLNIKKYCERIT
jgi:hypothetical protein